MAMLFLPKDRTQLSHKMEKEVLIGWTINGLAHNHVPPTNTHWTISTKLHLLRTPRFKTKALTL